MKLLALDDTGAPTLVDPPDLAGVQAQQAADERTEQGDVSSLADRITALENAPAPTPAPAPSGSSVNPPVFATVERSQTSSIARRVSDGAIIKQGTSPAAVIQAALDAASGFVQLGQPYSGVFDIDTPVVGRAKSGLTGHAVYVRAAGGPVGSVLKGSGLGAGAAVVQSGGDGFKMDGVGVHANGADYAFAHFLGSDVRLSGCVLSYANFANVFHKPQAGNFAFVAEDCTLFRSNNYGMRVESGTDGRITNPSIFESAQVCLSIAAGGWVLNGGHITHSSKLTTRVNTEILGTTCVVTGVYFDSCKNGPALLIGGAGATVTGNRVYNASDNNGSNLAIALDNAHGSTIVGNMTHTNSGTGMQWRTAGAPGSGVFAMNTHLNSTKGFVNAAGVEFPRTDTGALFIGPNPHTR